MSSYLGRRFNDPKYHIGSNISSDGKKKTLKLRANSEKATEVEIDEDGIVYARGFIDLNDDYELFLKNGKLYYSKSDGVGYVRELDIAQGETTFIQAVQMIEGWSDFLAYFQIPQERMSYLDVNRGFKYKKFKQSSQNKISSWYNVGEYVIFPEKSNEEYNQIYLADKISYKPFNYDVCIKPVQDVEKIFDIICIKTGEYNIVSDGLFAGKPSGLKQEKIVWVSPHESIGQSGVTLHTGISFSGYRNIGGMSTTGILAGQASATYSGVVQTVDRVVKTGIKILTSQNYILQSGQMLSGGATYNHSSKYYSGYSGIGDHAVLTGYKTSGVTSPAYLENTLFYQNYSGRMKRPKRPITGRFLNGNPMYGPKTTGYLKDNFATSYQWNGIIPSGTPFTIEVWNSNGRNYGHDSQFGIFPYTGVHGVSGGNWPYTTFEIVMTGQSKGGGDSWFAAEADGVYKAYQKILDKHEALLISNGIWETGSKGLRYAKKKRGEGGVAQKAGPNNDFRFNQSWTGVHGAEIVSGITGS